MIADGELVFWIVAFVIGIIAFGILYAKGKRESEKYISWVERGQW